MHNLLAVAAMVAAAQGRRACRGSAAPPVARVSAKLAARRVTRLLAANAVRRQIAVARSVAAGTHQPPDCISTLSARIQI